MCIAGATVRNFLRLLPSEWVKERDKKSIPSWWGEKSACSFAVNVLHECPFCTSHYIQSPYLHVYTISRTFLLSLCAPIFCCSLFLCARSARRDFPAKYKCSRTGFIIYSIVIFIALFTLSLSMRRSAAYFLSRSHSLTLHHIWRVCTDRTFAWRTHPRVTLTNYLRSEF
jgi:hypothetical protein